MFYWKVTHQHRLYGGLERKDIGIYHSFSLAEDAVAQLVTKEGFRDTSDGFLIRKVFRLFCPKLLDQTYWTDGFITYSDIENIDKKIICDETFYLMKHRVFLVNDYGFSFNKVSLGDLSD